MPFPFHFNSGGSPADTPGVVTPGGGGGAGAFSTWLQLVGLIQSFASATIPFGPAQFKNIFGPGFALLGSKGGFRAAAPTPSAGGPQSLGDLLKQPSKPAQPATGESVEAALKRKAAPAQKAAVAKQAGRLKRWLDKLAPTVRLAAALKLLDWIDSMTGDITAEDIQKQIDAIVGSTETPTRAPRGAGDYTKPRGLFPMPFQIGPELTDVIVTSKRLPEPAPLPASPDVLQEVVVKSKRLPVPGGLSPEEAAAKAEEIVREIKRKAGLIPTPDPWYVALLKSQGQAVLGTITSAVSQAGAAAQQRALISALQSAAARPSLLAQPFSSPASSPFAFSMAAPAPAPAPSSSTATATRTSCECTGNRAPKRKKGECGQGYFREKPGASTEFTYWSHRKCP